MSVNSSLHASSLPPLALRPDVATATQPLSFSHATDLGPLTRTARYAPYCRGFLYNYIVIKESEQKGG